MQEPGVGDGEVEVKVCLVVKHCIVCSGFCRHSYHNLLFFPPSILFETNEQFCREVIFIHPVVITMNMCTVIIVQCLGCILENHDVAQGNVT
jgi:hypothetical protein